MRSKATVVMLGLGMGLVTSVAVAWGCAWFAPATNLLSFGDYGTKVVGTKALDGSPVAWRGDLRMAPGMVFKNYMCSGLPFASQAESDSFDAISSDVASQSAIARHLFLIDGRDVYWMQFSVTLCGWPMPCLSSERAFTSADSTLHQMMISLQKGPDAYKTDPKNKLQNDYGALRYGTRVLPLRPLWSGLAVCTLLYATVWSGVIGFSLWCKRRLCRRANRCIRCGYSLAGLALGAACPECGPISEKD